MNGDPLSVRVYMINLNTVRHTATCTREPHDIKRVRDTVTAYAFMHMSVHLRVQMRRVYTVFSGDGLILALNSDLNALLR